jgi:hypothetical protein
LHVPIRGMDQPTLSQGHTYGKILKKRTWSYRDRERDGKKRLTHAMTVSVPLFNQTQDSGASPTRSGLPYEWIESRFAHVIAAGTTIAPMGPRERPGLAVWLFHDSVSWDGMGSSDLREGVRESLPTHWGRLDWIGETDRGTTRVPHRAAVDRTLRMDGLAGARTSAETRPARRGPYRRTLDQQPSSQPGRSPRPSGAAGILDVRLTQLSTRDPAVAGLAHAVCAAGVNHHWRAHAGVLLGEVVHQSRGRRRKVRHSLPCCAGQ